MRQAGILAAAGIYALRNNVERLAADHENAARLAAGLAARLEGVAHARVDVRETETNMVFLAVCDEHREHLAGALADQGILISRSNPVRLVTHLDVDARAIDTVIDAVGDYFREHG